MNNNSNNNNQPNRQPNRQRTDQQEDQPMTEQEILQRAFTDANGLINDAPKTLDEFNATEKALLINDNEALGLANTTPTWPVTTEVTSRNMRTVESHHRGGNYVNATMP